LANPWLKKNPFLSMWLSGANAVAGSVRGKVTQQARRQGRAVARKATTTMLDAWTAAVIPSRTRKKTRRTR
jgi:hypothetical protein